MMPIMTQNAKGREQALYGRSKHTKNMNIMIRIIQCKCLTVGEQMEQIKKNVLALAFSLIIAYYNKELRSQTKQLMNKPTKSEKNEH